jgi:hypothetical protein
MPPENWKRDREMDNTLQLLQHYRPGKSWKVDYETRHLRHTACIGEEHKIFFVLSNTIENWDWFVYIVSENSEKWITVGSGFGISTAIDAYDAMRRAYSNWAFAIYQEIR